MPLCKLIVCTHFEDCTILMLWSQKGGGKSKRRLENSWKKDIRYKEWSNRPIYFNKKKSSWSWMLNSKQKASEKGIVVHCLSCREDQMKLAAGKIQNKQEDIFLLMMVWSSMIDLALYYSLIQHETSKPIFQVLKRIWGKYFPIR